MRLHYGQKIGQSGYELVIAVFFSFFLHAAILVLALFFIMTVKPMVYVPPFYSVRLVRLPAELSVPLAPAPAAAPPALKPETVPRTEKPESKVEKSAPKQTKAAPTKSSMPAFLPQKSKAVHQAPVESEAEAPKQAVAPATPAVPAAAAGEGRGEGVAVSTASGDFKFPPYLDVLRDKIEQNWNPPPGVKGTKARVQFRVLRTGRVFGDVKIEESSGNGYFDMAAKRAILSSSPFPPMPEDFYKEYAEFSVDLMEKE